MESAFPVRKRPEWAYQMPGRGIGPGTFEKGLVCHIRMPIDTCQLRRHLSYPGVCHQVPDAIIRLPEIDQLIEHLSKIRGVFIDPVIFSCL